MSKNRSSTRSTPPATAKNELQSTSDDTSKAHESILAARSGAFTSALEVGGKDREAIIAINSRVRDAEDTLEFFRKYHQAFKNYYNKLWATTGTAEFMAGYGLEAEPLGHGDERGDHNMVQKTIERKDDGKETDIFFFRNWQIDLHEIKKDNAQAMFLDENVPLFMNTATAAVYLDLVMWRIAR